MNSEIYKSRVWEIAQFDAGSSQLLQQSHIFMFSGSIPQLYPKFGESLALSGVLRLPFPKMFLEFDTIDDDPDLSRLVLFCHEHKSDNAKFPISIFIHMLCKEKRKEWFFNPTPVQLLTGKPCDKLCVICRDKEYAAYDVITCLSGLGVLAHNSLLSRNVIIPKQVHKARFNKLPLYDFKIVNIGPPDAIRKPSIGTHASPALHWRRGHYRKLRNGSLTAISACLVGDPSNGIINKIYHSPMENNRAENSPLL